ncbi:4760_t:CDS:2, partial [Diversispora eburnea]
KGVQKVVVRKNLTHDMYEDCLKSRKETMITMHRLGSKDHIIRLLRSSKIERNKKRSTNTKLHKDTPIMIDVIGLYINLIYLRLKAVESELRDRKAKCKCELPEFETDNSDTSDEMESRSFASLNCSDILPNIVSVKKIHDETLPSSSEERIDTANISQLKALSLNFLQNISEIFNEEEVPKLKKASQQSSDTVDNDDDDDGGLEKMIKLRLIVDESSEKTKQVITEERETSPIASEIIGDNQNGEISTAEKGMTNVMQVNSTSSSRHSSP